jgi:nitrite reductase/ring-hydroxylating ferredoxin subunit
MRPMVLSEWRSPLDALAPGRTAKFRLRCGGRDVEGFVFRGDDQWHAYVNRCPHVGTPLDLWPNEFLTEDGRFFVCSTHGALFDPATGACVAGPCAGDALTPLTVVHEGDVVVVSCAPDPPAPPARRETGRAGWRPARADHAP